MSDSIQTACYNVYNKAYSQISEMLPDSKEIQKHLQKAGPLTLKVAKIAAIYLAFEAITHIPAVSAGVLSYNACIASCSGFLGPVCIAGCLPLLHPALP